MSWEEESSLEAARLVAVLLLAVDWLTDDGSSRFRARSAPSKELDGRNGLLKVVTGLPTDAVDGVGEASELSADACFC